MRPCYRPGCIDAIVSSSSSLLSLFPHPCHCRHVCYFSPSSLAFLLPCEKLLAAAVGGLVVLVLVLVVVIPDSVGLFGMDNNDEYPPDMWGKGSDVAEAVRNQQG